MKLWDKGISVDKLIENFTVGKDRELDLYLAPYDVLGTVAHVKMLAKIGLISTSELKLLLPELREIYYDACNGTFTIEKNVEDVHSQVELIMTRNLGDLGKKVHSGRSRNDQVLLDIKLFIRNELNEIVDLVDELFKTLIGQSEKYKEVLMPGYTHLQVAMPSSFGLWFGAYAESLTDDMQLLLSAYKISNQNPLGSAAGYGNSFPLDRQLTTDLLGFDRLNYNVVYAQMGRGKVEKTVAFALGSVASTISKMAMDACLYMGQNFSFISLPEEYTTGSSIMPHKKNPDVFELLRSKCNKIQALTNEISTIINNLPSGYFRDFQTLKESFLPIFADLKDCLLIANFITGKIVVNRSILNDDKYKYMFTVEEVNRKVLEGIPFRDAYKMVGESVEQGTFLPEKQINHTHEGSIGNLCNDRISEKMKEILSQFNFDTYKSALKKLLEK